MNYLIGIYTNEVKDYCDKDFIDNVYKLSQGRDVVLIDNSQSLRYYNRLLQLTDEYDNFTVHHIEVPYDPKATLFHRNVTTSVLFLRDLFLKGNYDYLFIIESDVFPPEDVIAKFEDSIKQIDDKNLGILGGLYYVGFHNYKLKGLQKTHHVLSGCTIYKRELIEKYPFRYDEKDLGPFPDAWICFDAGKEYSLWNNHDIICEHRHNVNGTRYSKPL